MTIVPIILNWMIATWPFLFSRLVHEIEQNEVSQHIQSTSSCVCSSNIIMTTQSFHCSGNVSCFSVRMSCWVLLSLLLFHHQMLISKRWLLWKTELKFIKPFMGQRCGYIVQLFGRACRKVICCHFLSVDLNYVNYLVGVHCFHQFCCQVSISLLCYWLLPSSMDTDLHKSYIAGSIKQGCWERVWSWWNNFLGSPTRVLQLKLKAHEMYLGSCNL